MTSKSLFLYTMGFEERGFNVDGFKKTILT